MSNETTSERRHVATIYRGSRSRPKDAVGPDSRRFYSPLMVSVMSGEQRIYLSSYGYPDVGLWPEEAEELGLALIKAANRGN